MNSHEQHVADKRKEREQKNAAERARETAVENEQNRYGSAPRHYLFYIVGAVLVLCVLMTWMFLF